MDKIKAELDQVKQILFQDYSWTNTELDEFEFKLSDVIEAQKQLKKLNIDDGVKEEFTDCIHSFYELRIIGGNISCLKCKGYWKRKS